LGAHPLSFEEGSDGGHPLDRLDLTVSYNDALKDDSTEFLATGQRRGGDRLRQREDPSPIRVEVGDAVAVGR